MLPWRRVTVAMTRLGQGNFSNVEGVGASVYELKIDIGPGIECTSARTARLVILLGGSAKKRQGAAIAAAQRAWVEYRHRKSGKEHDKWR